MYISINMEWWRAWSHRRVGVAVPISRLYCVEGSQASRIQLHPSFSFMETGEMYLVFLFSFDRSFLWFLCLAAKNKGKKRWRHLPKEPQACERALNWIERVARPIKHARSMKLRVCHTVLPLLWRRKRKETQHTQYTQTEWHRKRINKHTRRVWRDKALSLIDLRLHPSYPLADVTRHPSGASFKKYNLDFLFQFEEKLVWKVVSELKRASKLNPGTGFRLDGFISEAFPTSSRDELFSFSTPEREWASRAVNTIVVFNQLFSALNTHPLALFLHFIRVFHPGRFMRRPVVCYWVMAESSWLLIAFEHGNTSSLSLLRSPFPLYSLSQASRIIVIGQKPSKLTLGMVRKF